MPESIRFLGASWMTSLIKITLLSLNVFLMISQLPPLCKEIFFFHPLQN